MSRRHRKMDQKIIDLKVMGMRRASEILSEAIASGNIIRQPLPPEVSERIRAIRVPSDAQHTRVAQTE